MIKKSFHEINRKIEDGSVNVVTAEEMVTIVEELGAEGAAKEVDVVTTGTFGAMCSSGSIPNNSRQRSSSSTVLSSRLKSHVPKHEASNARLFFFSASSKRDFKFPLNIFCDTLVKSTAKQAGVSSPNTSIISGKIFNNLIGDS